MTQLYFSHICASPNKARVPAEEADAALLAALRSIGVPFSQMALDRAQASGRLAAALAVSGLLAEAVAAVQAELADMPDTDMFCFGTTWLDLTKQDKVGGCRRSRGLGLAQL